MERNFNMKIEMTPFMAKRLGITKDSIFETYFEDGVLSIRALTKDEVDVLTRGFEEDEEAEYESFGEAYADGLSDGRTEGYEAGYRIGFSHCLEKKPFNQEYPGDYVLFDDDDCDGEDCEDCEFFCHHCGKCGKEESV